MISPEAVAAHKRRTKALSDSSLSPRQKAAAILDALPPWPDIYWHGADGQPCACASCSTAALREMAPVLRQLAAGVDLEHEQQTPVASPLANTKVRSQRSGRKSGQRYCECGCGQVVPKPERGYPGRYVNEAHRSRARRQA